MCISRGQGGRGTHILAAALCWRKRGDPSEAGWVLELLAKLFLYLILGR